MKKVNQLVRLQQGQVIEGAYWLESGRLVTAKAKRAISKVRSIGVQLIVIYADAALLNCYWT
jgi:hypothetical protein